MMIFGPVICVRVPSRYFILFFYFTLRPVVPSFPAQTFFFSLLRHNDRSLRRATTVIRRVRKSVPRRISIVFYCERRASSPRGFVLDKTSFFFLSSRRTRVVYPGGCHEAKRLLQNFRSSKLCVSSYRFESYSL